MTVNALYRKLQKLCRDGHGRRRVSIDKSTFTHPLEADGAVVLDIESVHVRSVPQVDDDGFQRYDSRGRGVEYLTLVLSGTAGQRCCGMTYGACPHKDGV